MFALVASPLYICIQTQRHIKRDTQRQADRQTGRQTDRQRNTRDLRKLKYKYSQKRHTEETGRQTEKYQGSVLRRLTPEPCRYGADAAHIHCRAA